MRCVSDEIVATTTKLNTRYLMEHMCSLRNKKLFFLTFLYVISQPAIAFADIPTFWTEYTSPLIPIIFLIESAYFWFYTNVLLNLQLKPLKIVMGVVLANIFTAIFGAIFSARTFTVYVILIALTISVIIEWVVYIIVFKKHIRVFDLLRISFVGNSITHTIIALLL